MKPHRVEMGERYPDNSGWQRHVTVDILFDEVQVAIDSYSLQTTIEEIDFIIDSLTKAKELLGIS